MINQLRWIPAHDNLVVLAERKLLFCPIPRVACSNWKITLRHAIGFEDNSGTIAHDRDRNGLTYLKDVPILQRTYLLISSGVTRAVFIRNPWTRTLSAFRSKLEGVRLADVTDPQLAWKRTVLENVDEPITFKRFLDYLERSDPLKLNEHWRPQVYLANFETINYNFVGRMENLEQDAAYLCKKCGLPPFFTGDLPANPKTNSSEHDKLMRYYDIETIEQVARIYEKDIEFGGYEFPAG